MGKILSFNFIMVACLLLFLNSTSMSYGETKSMICSCWLTAYDYGIKKVKSDSSQYKTGYSWCKKNGAQCGKSWVSGWQAGIDTAAGKKNIPRNCYYFFGK